MTVCMIIVYLELALLELCDDGDVFIVGIIIAIVVCANLCVGVGNWYLNHEHGFGPC
jgi:hypothetical protein